MSSMFVTARVAFHDARVGEQFYQLLSALSEPERSDFAQRLRDAGSALPVPPGADFCENARDTDVEALERTEDGSIDFSLQLGLSVESEVVDALLDVVAGANPRWFGMLCTNTQVGESMLYLHFEGRLILFSTVCEDEVDDELFETVFSDDVDEEDVFRGCAKALLSPAFIDRLHLLRYSTGELILRGDYVELPGRFSGRRRGIVTHVGDARSRGFSFGEYGISVKLDKNGLASLVPWTRRAWIDADATSCAVLLRAANSSE